MLETLLSAVLKLALRELMVLLAVARSLFKA